MADQRNLKVFSRHAPARLAIAAFSLAVIVSCGGGGGGPANMAPVANAGTAQTVNEQASVTLNGTGSSDSDGSISRFQWAQTSGPGVTLTNATVASPSFTAPAVAADTDLAFRLTVTDNGGATDSETVSVTVRAVFTLSGTISSPAVAAVDSDTNDPNAPFAPNDSINQAQTISNPITIGGYVNQPGEGAPGRSQTSGDIDDYYRVALLAGQTITMLVADFQTGDADLSLYDDSGLLVAASVNTGEIESIVVPADGIYFVNPAAFSGASNYVLVIGNVAVTATRGGLNTADEFVPGQAVVRYRNDLSPGKERAVQSAVARTGFSLRSGDPDRPMLLELDMQSAAQATATNAADAKKMSFRNAGDRARWDTLMAIKALQNDPAIAYAEPNYIVTATAIPNDPAYTAQWHFPMINLPAAWDLTTGNPNVIVAVIDTGILLGHPDLQGQLITGYDFISDAATAGDGDGIDPDPNDPGDGPPSSFHGTHVAGTVAAASNNNIGVAGVAWNARLMPLRVLGIDGGTSYDVGQAVRYAAGLANDSGTVPAQRADVMNLSLGGGGFSQASQDAFTAARNAGVVIVASAGNDASSQLFYPASYDGVISVSAVDIERRLAPYSNFGSAIDVAAPGGDTSTDLNADGFGDGVLSTGGSDSSGSLTFSYPFFSGTSMSSPHVAGVIALMKSVNANLTPAIIDQELAGGSLTDDIGATGRDDNFGHGLINAHKAVARALTLDNMPPPEIPVLGVSPSSLNFDAATTSIEITAQNVGTGTLQPPITVTSSETWITATPAVVDANNLGTYLVTVDRSGLADDLYSAEIVVQSAANTVTLSVIMTVGASGLGGNVGFIYLLLIDADTGDVADAVAPSVSEGDYSFNFFNVLPGSYQLVAGTDADNDLFICDVGEACGVYLTSDQPVVLDVNGDLSDLDFPVGIFVALPSVTGSDDDTTASPAGQSRVVGPRSRSVSQ